MKAGETKFSPERQEIYLGLLRDGKGRYEAARTVGLNPETIRRYAQSNAEWQDSVREAELEYVERAENAVKRLAVEEEEPWALKEVLGKLGRKAWQPKDPSITVNHVGVAIVGQLGGGADGLSAGLSDLLGRLEGRRATEIEATGQERQAIETSAREVAVEG